MDMTFCIWAASSPNDLILDCTEALDILESSEVPVLDFPESTDGEFLDFPDSMDEEFLEECIDFSDSTDEEFGIPGEPGGAFLSASRGCISVDEDFDVANELQTLPGVVFEKNFCTAILGSAMDETSSRKDASLSDTSSSFSNTDF